MTLLYRLAFEVSQSLRRFKDPLTTRVHAFSNFCPEKLSTGTVNAGRGRRVAIPQQASKGLQIFSSARIQSTSIVACTARAR